MASDGLELRTAARRDAESAWRDGYGYTKAGSMLDELMIAELRPRRCSKAIRKCRHG